MMLPFPKHPLSLQARRQAPCGVRMGRPAEALLCPGTAPQEAGCSPEDDFALKLYWGRQRGLAVIFAADAMECAQRCHLSHDSSTPFSDHMPWHLSDRAPCTLNTMEGADHRYSPVPPVLKVSCTCNSRVPCAMTQHCMAISWASQAFTVILQGQGGLLPGLH